MGVTKSVRAACVAVAGVVAMSAMSACDPAPPPVTLERDVPNLEAPVSFAIDPNNGIIWYAERYTGEIRRRNLLSGADVLVWTVPDLITVGEQGLFGLALHPNFPTTRTIYAYANQTVSGAARNRVLRIDMNTSFVGTASSSIFSEAGGPGDQHVGGRLQTGPDGMLYLSIGDHEHIANAQNLANTAGKVLRMTTTGGVPSDNPITGSHIWAYGVRNSFGFDFDPVNAGLWFTDNGPTCNDEINRTVRGGNFAWGTQQTCGTPPEPPLNTNQSGPTPRQLPKKFYGATVGITGAAFCEDCGIQDADGKLLVGAANNGNIRLLTLSGDRLSVSSDILLKDHNESILSMESRPGQPIYFSTFNAIWRIAPG
jgi:glucose/arabinose dehydrogenase